MSNTIDNRVVSLEFDNARFEKNVATSMSTLDKLKEKLHFKGATKGLEEIEAASGHVNMSALGNAVEHVKLKFSALEAVALGALFNIGSSVVSAGEKLVKSLSVDQITEGFAKYEKKTNSVQTIMNAISDRFKDEGERMNFVNEQLERMNWFTDETSYNFVDMVDNVGKFVNNGVELERAVDAMQGIATWAALSGANAMQASHAMYNLSQAMGVGYVQLIDWKSIENAQMATREFKQMAIDAAVAIGTIRDFGDGTYQDIEGSADAFNLDSFNASLTKGRWLTREVLTSTLENYGSFATALHDVVEDINGIGDVSTIKMIGYARKYKEGSLELSEAAEETGISAEKLEGHLKTLTASEYELGLKAFIAAQESRTFADVINYTKDAVSTGWMNTFEHIFGNYTEAVRLWSDLSETMYDVFVKSGDDRNELLAEWHEIGGRDALIEGLWNSINALVDILQIAREALAEVFPPITAERLKELTEGFRDFTENFKMTEETAEKVKDVFKGVFSVFRIGFDVLKAVGTLLRPVITLLKSVWDIALSVFGGFGFGATVVADFLSQTQILQSAAEWLVGLIELIPQRLGELFQAITGMNFKDAISFIGVDLKNYASLINSFFSELLGVDVSGSDKVSNGFDQVKNVYDRIRIWFDAAWTWILQVIEKTRSFFVGFSNVFKFNDAIIGFVEAFRKTISGLSGIDFVPMRKNAGVLSQIVEFLRTLFNNGIDVLKNGAEKFEEKLEGFFLFIKGLYDNFDFGKLFDAARAFRKFVNSVVKLFRGGAFTTILLEIAGLIRNVKKVFKQLAGFIKQKKNAQKFENIKTIAESFLMVAGSLLLIASAIKLLATIKDPSLMVKGAVAIGLIFAAMGVFLGVVGSQKKTTDGEGLLSFARRFDGNTMLKAAGSIAIMCFALKKIAKAIKTVSEIGDLNTIITSTGVLAVFLAELGGLAIAFGALGGSKYGFSEKGALAGAAAVLILAFAMKLVGKAIKQLSGITDVTAVLRSVAVMSLMLVELGGLAIAFGALCYKFVGMEAGMLAGAASILIMAVAIRMIATPFRKIGKMDWTQIEKALVTIGAVLLEMGVIVAILGFISPFGAIAGALTMVIMAAVLRMIVKPLMKLAGMSWGAIDRALEAMKGALREMALIAGLLGIVAPFGAIAGALTMLIMAKMLQQLIGPFTALGNMPFGNIVKALAAMGGALTEMGVIAGLLGLVSPLSILGALTMKLMVEALAEIIAPLQALAAMKWTSLLKSIIAMTLVFNALSKTANGKVKLFGFLQGIAFKNLAEALDIIITPLERLSEMNWMSLLKSIIAMKFIFTEMSTALEDSGIGSLFDMARAKAFEILADAMYKMAPAVETMCGLDQEAFSNVMGVLGTAFNSFGSALKGTPWLYPSGRAEGIGTLVDNIKNLSDTLPGFLDIVKEYGEEAVAFSLTKIGEAFKIFGVALQQTPWLYPTGRAEGIGTLCDNISRLTETLPPFMDAINGRAEEASASLGMIGTAFETFGEALKGSPFFNAEGKASAVETVIGSITKLTDGLISFMGLPYTPEEISSAFTILSDGIEKIGGAVKKFDPGKAIVNVDGFTVSETSKAVSFERTAGALTVFADALKVLIASSNELDSEAFSSDLDTVSAALIKFCEDTEGLEIKVDGFEQAGLNAGNAFADNFRRGVIGKRSEMTGAVSTIASACVSAVRAKYGDFKSAGSYLMDGLKAGIQSGSDGVTDAVTTIAKDLNSRFSGLEQIKSPSKVFRAFGRFLDLGLVKGIEEYANKVYTVTEEMAQGTNDAANKAFYGNDIFGDSFDSTMTITPVLDLSEIQNDRARLANTLDGFGIGTSISLAETNAANMARRTSATERTDKGVEKLTELIKDLIDNPPSVNNNAFNITNGDPNAVAQEVERRLTRDIVRRNAVWRS